MATIEKRIRQGGTVYMADIRIKGFPRQKKTFRHLTDARMWSQQTGAAIRKGEFQNVVKAAKNRTLADVIERYKDDILPTKAQSTQRAEATYLNFWEREFPALGRACAHRYSQGVEERPRRGEGN